MKYLVLFQDRIKKMIVEAKNESEASVKAFKRQGKIKMMVISARLITSLLLFFVFCSFVQDGDPEPFKFTWHTLVLIIAGFYEVLARLIPTVKDISLLGKIIEILLWISNFLNVKKKKK